MNFSDAIDRIEAELPATKERDEIILFVRNANEASSVATYKYRIINIMAAALNVVSAAMVAL